MFPRTLRPRGFAVTLFLLYAGCAFVESTRTTRRGGVLPPEKEEDRFPRGSGAPSGDAPLGDDDAKRVERARDSARLAPTGAPRPIDVSSYALRGKFDWSRKTLVAEADITLRVLDASLDKIELDSRVSQILAVKRGEQVVPFEVRVEEGLAVLDITRLSPAEKSKPLTFTIAYEAPAGRGGLHAVAARQGDTAPGRVVYTASEPLGVARWMPCHNVPSDRATFSITFELDERESLVANGTRLDDGNPAGSSRRAMTYATRYSLPTYLMAFAVGEFERTQAQAGSVPLSIWHRPGVPGDYADMLAEVARLMGLYERLLVPYPFEKYDIVLLPDFPAGGIEHAGVTFQAETRSTRSQVTGDRILTAHELAHQWFGDLASVASWDDLWIKEGMATLLAQEAIRPAEAGGTAVSHLGDSFWPENDEAIRDRKRSPEEKYTSGERLRSPEEKYTSGPYDRAAWLFTQLREVTGESVFWDTMRGLLERHRFGNISTDDVVTAFAPSLPADGKTRLLRAIDAQALPRLGVGLENSSGANSTATASIFIEDPDGALIAPVTLTVRSPEAGEGQRNILPASSSPLRLALAPVSWVTFDERSVHPWARLLEAMNVPQRDALTSLERFPLSRIADFTRLPGPVQARSLGGGIDAKTSPENFVSFFDGLHSHTAKTHALQAACALAGETPDAAWISALRPRLETLPLAGTRLEPRRRSLAMCQKILPLETFTAEWTRFRENPADAAVDEARLIYLSHFILPPQRARETWGSLALQGATVRTRRIATQQLVRYLTDVETTAGFSALSSEDANSLAQLFANILETSQVSEVTRPSLTGARLALKVSGTVPPASLLPAVTRIVQDPTSRSQQGEAVCLAASLLGAPSEPWNAWVSSLTAPLASEGAQVLLKDPSVCDKETF